MWSVTIIRLQETEFTKTANDFEVCWQLWLALDKTVFVFQYGNLLNQWLVLFHVFFSLINNTTLDIQYIIMFLLLTVMCLHLRNRRKTRHLRSRKEPISLRNAQFKSFRWLQQWLRWSSCYDVSPLCTTHYAMSINLWFIWRIWTADDYQLWHGVCLLLVCLSSTSGTTVFWTKGAVELAVGTPIDAATPASSITVRVNWATTMTATVVCLRPNTEAC